ncbi:hypothetical protein GE21DRAFT_1210764 [Neurospora crassa]|nr:hypothetical protein B17C10.10 [imported] - Neurospora crassa [Neurospora crassa]KHE83593.1 hypothetical protein GE21DRAFT_1210764 [Neurospora crassa]
MSGPGPEVCDGRDAIEGTTSRLPTYLVVEVPSETICLVGARILYTLRPGKPGAAGSGAVVIQQKERREMGWRTSKPDGLGGRSRGSVWRKTDGHGRSVGGTERMGMRERMGCHPLPLSRALDLNPPSPACRCRWRCRCGPCHFSSVDALRTVKLTSTYYLGS